MMSHSERFGRAAGHHLLIEVLAFMALRRKP
jgi:hypothetical protein